METIRGALKDFVPVIPVSVRTLDESWQELEVLLDTGSGYPLVLKGETAIQHRVALGFDHRMQAPVPYVEFPGDSVRETWDWVEVQLGGYGRAVQAQFLKHHCFAGHIGPGLLSKRRLIVDVREGGAVTIGEIPRSTSFDRIRRLVHKPKRQRPYPDYWWKLPWTNVTLNDREGRCYPCSVNVDTGHDGELCLPPSYVQRLGLNLAGKTLMHTSKGRGYFRCGEAEILWEGQQRMVKCIEHEECKPPLIGMKLLWGKRITIDFDEWAEAPMAQIGPIP